MFWGKCYEFKSSLKENNAAIAAATAAGMTIPTINVKASDTTKMDKAPCRFVALAVAY